MEKWQLLRLGRRFGIGSELLKFSRTKVLDFGLLHVEQSVIAVQLVNE